MGTFANSEDPDILWHFIWVCTISGDKIKLQRKKYNFFFEIIIYDPSIYTMDHPDLTVSNIIVC